MIAQLTHLRPKPGKFEAVMEVIDRWSTASASDADMPLYSFVSHADDHLFVVSIYQDEAAYGRSVSRHDYRRKELMELLIDNHGPTYFGPVLRLSGDTRGDIPKTILSGLCIPHAK